MRSIRQHFRQRFNVKNFQVYDEMLARLEPEFHSAFIAINGNKRATQKELTRLDERFKQIVLEDKAVDEEEKVIGDYQEEQVNVNEPEEQKEEVDEEEMDDNAGNHDIEGMEQQIEEGA